MAQLLIRAQPTHLSNRMKQETCCYHQGDPVLVMGDGHVWGKEEGLPKFWIIQIPETTKAEMESYIIPDERVDFFSGEHIDMVHRRAFGFDIDNLGVEERGRLLTTGVLSLELDRFKLFMRDKRI